MESIIGQVQGQKPCIVLTGGQCSGKSELQEWLRQEHRKRFLMVQELARFTRDQFGYHPNAFTEDVQAEYQQALYSTQCSLEHLASISSLQSESEALILDRATLDGCIYYPLGRQQWFADVGTSLFREYCRYALVIYLEMVPEEIYARRSALLKDRSPSEFSVAKERAEQLHDLWRGHPNFVFIPNENDFVQKCKSALEAIDRFLDGVRITDSGQIRNSFIRGETDGGTSKRFQG